MPWHTHRSFVRTAACAVVALVLLPRAARAADPCALLTPAEIAQATGAPVSAMKAAGPGICTGTAPGFDVMLRLAERKGESTGMEDAGTAMIRKMGGQVEIRTFGAMTCSTIVPPATLVSSMGFNTTCSIRKGGWVAAVEVAARDRRAQVPIDTLRPIAEKMTSRF